MFSRRKTSTKINTRNRKLRGKKKQLSKLMWPSQIDENQRASLCNMKGEMGSSPGIVGGRGRGVESHNILGKARGGKTSSQSCLEISKGHLSPDPLFLIARARSWPKYQVIGHLENNGHIGSSFLA